MTRVLRSLLFGASLAALPAVWGELPDARADVTYDGFGDTSNLQLNGAAAAVATSDGTVLRVTPAVAGEAGSFFSLNKVSTAEFTSVFSFRITQSGGSIFDFNDEPGADGLVFVVQNVANNVGSAGQGIGYESIGTSLGVEFDTWGNSVNADPSQSHVGINVNGSVTHNLPGMGPTINVGNTNAEPTPLPGPELDDGVRWWSWVLYDGFDIEVFLLQSESATEPALPATPILSFPVDLDAILGGGAEAYAGFTSGTGLDWANHDVIYWRYTEQVVPEPSSIGLAAICGAVLGTASRRRQRRA